MIPLLQAHVARRTLASPFALEAYFCQGCYHQTGARAPFHSQSNYGKTQTMNLCVPLVRMSEGSAVPFARIKLSGPFVICETSRQVCPFPGTEQWELEGGSLSPPWAGSVDFFPLRHTHHPQIYPVAGRGSCLPWRPEERHFPARRGIGETVMHSQP